MIDTNFDELERHLSWAQSYYKDLKDEVENKIRDLNNQIKKLAAYITQLEEQNVLLEEQVGELTHEKVFLGLELTEVTNELIKLRHELDISR